MKICCEHCDSQASVFIQSIHNACYLLCGFSTEIHRIKNCIPRKRKSYGIPIFMESIGKFGGVIIRRLTFCRQTFHQPTTH